MEQSGVKPQINGRYDLREVELSNHFMSRTYHDYWIRIFTNAYQCILKKHTLPDGYITQVVLNGGC